MYNLGPDNDNREDLDDDEKNFEQPREITSGSRFQLKYDFNRYRAGKTYQSKLESVQNI